MTIPAGGAWLSGLPVPMVVPPVDWLYHFNVPALQVADSEMLTPSQILVLLTDTFIGAPTTPLTLNDDEATLALLQLIVSHAA